MIYDIGKQKMLSHLNLESAKLENGAKVLSSLVALVYLSLANVEGEIDDLVSGLGYKCPELTYLDISNCALSRRTLRTLGSLEKLEILLASNTAIGDRALYEFKNIIRGEFQGCRYLTDEGIMSIIKNCPRLFSINIYNTRATHNVITETEIYRSSRETNINLTILLSVKVLYDHSLSSGRRIPRCLSKENHHQVVEIILGPAKTRADTILAYHIVGTEVKFV